MYLAPVINCCKPTSCWTRLFCGANCLLLHYIFSRQTQSFRHKRQLTMTISIMSVTFWNHRFLMFTVTDLSPDCQSAVCRVRQDSPGDVSGRCCQLNGLPRTEHSRQTATTVWRQERVLRGGRTASGNDRHMSRHLQIFARRLQVCKWVFSRDRIF